MREISLPLESRKNTLSFHKHESFSQRDQEAAEFSGKLLQLGEGNAPSNSNGFVELQMFQTLSLQQLIESVFTNIERNYTNAKWLCEQAILAPKNTDAEMYKTLLLLIPGDSRVYKSVGNPAISL